HRLVVHPERHRAQAGSERQQRHDRAAAPAAVRWGAGGPARAVARCAVKRGDIPADAAPAGAMASAAQAAVWGSGIHKWFGHTHVLDDVSFEVGSGEVVVIIGPSGSGKTTLLRCMNHLERIDKGRLLVNGHLIGYRVNANGELTEESE